MSTPNFCAWEAVKLEVAASLHVAPESLPEAWDVICARAARRAAGELRRIFILKGYPAEAVARWDDANTYSLQLGTFWALVAGAGLASYDLKAAEHLDCRKELQEAGALIIDGVATAPSGSDVGGLAHGRNTSVDLLLDPNGTGWGMGTEWCW